jgi:hypothetical protein
VREILKAMDGRLVENGGIYKLFIGPPALPVVHITDGDLRADEGDVFRPIRVLEERINHVTGRYTAPEDGWIPKVVPARTDPAFEAADGRRVTGDLDAPFVQSGKHIQRLQRQMLFRARKERRHTIPLGPEFWGLEPGDVLAWNSDRNGYIDKLFDVLAVEDYHDLSITVHLLEIDEDDYDWTPETDLIPEPDGSLVTGRPPAKQVQTFQAFPFIHQHLGLRRPAIKVQWAPPEDGDIRAVVFQVRLAGASMDEASMARTDDPEVGGFVIWANLLPDTDYEVRAWFESINGFAVERTLFMPVRTPDVRIGAGEFDAAISAKIEQLELAAQASLARGIEAHRQDLDSLAQQVMGLWARLDEQDQIVAVGVGRRALQTFSVIEDERSLRASAIIEVNAGLAGAQQALIAESDARQALVAMLAEVFASGEHGDAAAMFRLIAQSAPDGVVARLALEAKAAAGEFDGLAGLYLDAVAGVGTRATIRADLFVVEGTSGQRPFEVFDGQVRARDLFVDMAKILNLLIDGSLHISDNTIITGKLQPNAITQAIFTMAGNVQYNAETTVISATINATGNQPIIILYNGTTTTTGNQIVRIRRDGILLRESFKGLGVTELVQDIPISGAHNYTVTMQSASATDQGINYQGLQLMELKR